MCRNWTCSGSDMFKCKGIKCLRDGSFCPADPLCSRKQNSTTCPLYKPCHSDYMRCPGEKKCVSKKYQICNGKTDCSSGADEICNATVCNSLKKVYCRKTNRCEYLTAVCENITSCDYGFEMENLTCPPCGTGFLDHYGLCSRSKKCLLKSKYCRNKVNCPLKRDIFDYNCLDTDCWRDFKCSSDGKCIDQKSVCNGVRDCSRGEDETNCASQVCPITTVKCLSDYKCVDALFACAGHSPCNLLGKSTTEICTEFCRLMPWDERTSCYKGNLECLIYNRNDMYGVSEIDNSQMDCYNGQEELRCKGTALPNQMGTIYIANHSNVLIWVSFVIVH